jgi:hypothetical protein
MVGGIVFFSGLAANFAALLIRNRPDAISTQIESLEHRIDRLSAQIGQQEDHTSIELEVLYLRPQLLTNVLRKFRPGD